MQIANHTYVITGGSSGLGRATAMLLAEQSANIVIADIDVEAGEQLTAEIDRYTLYIHTDVTDTSSIEAALAKTIENFGEVHGLINCAGILIAERVLKKDGQPCELKRFSNCLEINLTGTFNAIRLAAPLMVDNTADDNGERGIIINTASIAAYDGQTGQAAYAASKAGIIGMTLPLARELADSGIRVMSIAPGVFETPMFADISDPVRDELIKQIPFPARLGKPSEFAALVQHIIENPMLNGEVIRLDGALRMSG